MDLSKVKDEVKRDLCRRYFFYGLAFLPFLWAVNAVWFYKEAFKRSPFPEQKEIRKYSILSGLGAIIWIIILGTWVIVYQTNRASWGELGDDLSFILPQGRP
ncbi:gamma-secretase subunit pen-2-like [Folsomia candida]|uniref:gamma-secretase subunit pen-2-like n=1 Tax=Folsomia candida TaxID=158441 RepID=UPI000B90133F|nr:gamma-secretase subunit pen-2-like [Folsomia candida]